MVSEANPLPQVSVIIPAYNAAKFIRETVEHAIAQTYPNMEILVINDGSSDETASVVESFGDAVRLISTENRGVARARNTGIEAATGEFVAFLDSDDLWEPEKLTIQVDALDEGHRLVYTDSISFGTESLSNINISVNEKLPSGDIRAQLILRNFIPTSSVLLDRQIALQIGGFNPEIPVCDDWDLWLRALSVTGAKYVDQPLVRYRVHENSLGSSVEKRMSGSFQVIDSGLKILDIDAKEKKAMRGKAIAECYSYAATLARSEARSVLAIKLFLKAFFYFPTWSLVKEIVKTLLGRK